MQDFDSYLTKAVYSKAMTATKSRVTLTQLRAFVAVAQHSSYSEAALETMQSQSTLSHAISELEKSLNTTLFERGRRGARLSELGERLLEHAKHAIDSADALEQEVKLEQNDLSGTIRIMSIRSAATFILPPIISEFMQRYPKVNFEFLEEGDDDNLIEDALRGGRADLGILESPFSGDGLVEFELARDEYVLLESQKSRANRSWQEIIKKPFIMCVGGCTRHLREHWETLGIPLEPAFKVREDSVILGMVAQGLGVSILPRLAVEPLPVGVRATALPTPLWRKISLATTRRKLRQPALREFVQAIRSAVNRVTHGGL